MYHAIVRAKLRAAFAETSRTHDAEKTAAQFAPDAVLAFAGDSELGGERHGCAAIAAWFRRLFATFADFRLEPLTIVVNGPPWATTVATRFQVKATLPDGTAYANEGMQYVRLRWGRIVEDRIYEDTAKLERALAVVARHRADRAHAGNGAQV